MFHPWLKMALRSALCITTIRHLLCRGPKVVVRNHCRGRLHSNCRRWRNGGCSQQGRMELYATRYAAGHTKPTNVSATDQLTIVKNLHRESATVYNLRSNKMYRRSQRLAGHPCSDPPLLPSAHIFKQRTAVVGSGLAYRTRTPSLRNVVHLICARKICQSDVCTVAKIVRRNGR